MKRWIYLVVLTIISCNSQQQNAGNSRIDGGVVSKDQKTETCWMGTLNDKIPVFIHYQLDGTSVIGEITYLNTKDKRPIKLLGTIEDNKNYRLLEFDETGNITGIITGNPGDNYFNGSWFSPKTKKELVLKLDRKDTMIASHAIAPNLQDVFGTYHYQYSEEGYQGDFEIKKLSDSKASFGIVSITGAPGRNIAQIEDDTINLNATQFIYKVPETDSCEFEVKFYKGFAVIQYTKGGCEAQFGMNATIDGIFLKTK